MRKVEWVARVKAKKTGNRQRPNGTWSRGRYTIYSISIPSEQARRLRLTPSAILKVTASRVK
jgi:hypothetical protein